MQDLNGTSLSTDRFGAIGPLHETEHGFHSHMDADNDTLRIKNEQRPKSQSVYEQSEDLQSQIFEFQKKEKDWNALKAQMEETQKALEAELDKVKKEMIALMEEMIVLMAKNDKNEDDIKVDEDDEDLPLMNHTSANRRTHNYKNNGDVDANKNSCVLFGFSLW